MLENFNTGKAQRTYPNAKAKMHLIDIFAGRTARTNTLQTRDEAREVRLVCVFAWVLTLLAQPRYLKGWGWGEFE